MTSNMDLQKLVLDKIAALGSPAVAQEYFGVSPAAISTWKSGKIAPTLKAAQKVLDEMPATETVQVPPLQILETVAPPEPEATFGSEQVVLLMPMYESVEPLAFITLVRSMKLYGMDKISIIPITRTLIDEARNSLVQKFMAIPSKPEWCVFVDADQIFPCGHGGILKKMGLELPEPKASRNFLTRLMSHPKEARIVGALYKNRRGSFKPAVEIAYRSPQEDARIRGLFDGKTKTDGLEETGWIGFGGVRIHRSVFEEMQAAAVPGGALAEIAPPVGRERDAFGYFGRTAAMRGEDIAFSRRAGKIGIKVWCDHGLCMGHQGKQFNLT